MYPGSQSEADGVGDFVYNIYGEECWGGVKHQQCSDPPLEISLRNIPSGIEISYDRFPTTWHSNPPPTIDPKRINLKISENVAIGPFTMDIVATNGTATKTSTIYGEIVDPESFGISVPIAFDCNQLSNNSSLEEAKYCLGGNYIGTGGGVDVWDGINVMAYLNSTSPTGRTLQVSAPDIAEDTIISFHIQNTSFPSEPQQHPPTYYYKNWYNLVDGDWQSFHQDPHTDWYIPIPVDYNEPIEIFWRLTTPSNYPYAITINGKNIDGTTSPIPVPSLGSVQQNIPAFNCYDLSNNSSLEEAKYCLGGNYIGTGGGVDVWDGINVMAYLNSTSPTGRTLQVSAPDIAEGTAIFFEVSDKTIFESNDAPGWEENHWNFLSNSNQIGYNNNWNIPIPLDYDKPIEVFWKLTAPYEWPGAVTINGKNIDGITSPITAPALGSEIIDTVPPTIFTNSDIKLFVTNSSKIPVTYSEPYATDNMGISVVPICSPSSGSFFSVGTHSVNCIGYDDAGLKGSKSFEISIINTNAKGDNQHPVFTKKQDIIINSLQANGATVKYDLPMVSDNVGVIGQPTCSPASGSFFDISETTVNCTAYDAENNKASTTFKIIVTSPVVKPIEIPTSISISVGKPEYNTEEKLFVRGTATPFTENNITINVRDESDKLVSVEYLLPTSIGEYTGIISPSSLWNTSGNYTVSATYGTSVDDASFEFEFMETEIDNSNTPTGINLTIDTLGYLIGDTISLKSQLIDGTSGQLIEIDVKDSSGNIVEIQSLNTDNSGSISLSFMAQESWEPGTYIITASDGSPLWDYSTSESIQILQPLPEITISPTITTTESGDEIESYKAGDIGYFSTSLLSESTSDVLVTINVVDAEDTTLGLSLIHI